jgi:hypothetical protein
MDFGILSTLVSLLTSLVEGPNDFALNPTPKQPVISSQTHN